MSKKHFLIIIVKALISIGFISWVIHSSGIENIKQAFSSINPLLFVLAIICFAFSGVLGSLQWYLLLRHHDLDIKYREVLGHYFTGLFFNNFLLSYVGGDAVRIFAVGRKTQQATVAVSTTLADRAIGFFMLSGMSVIAFFAVTGIEKSKMFPIICGIFVIILLCFSLVIFRKPGKIIGWLLKRTIPAKIYDAFRKIYYELRSLKSEPGMAVLYLLISFGIQFLRIIVHYFCALSIGISIEFHNFLIFIPLVAIAASLPISIGGIGVREQSAEILFRAAGLAPGQATTMELLAFASGIIASIPGGLYFILTRESKS